MEPRRPPEEAGTPLSRRPSGLVLASETHPVTLTEAIRAGELERVRRGAYFPRSSPRGAAADHEENARRRIEALARQLETRFWFSHESAALIWGWWTVALGPRTHVTQLYTHNGETDRAVQRHCGELPLPDRDSHDGLPVTSPVRTVLDCAMSLPVERGLVIADDAVRTGVARSALAQRVSTLAGRRGVRRARLVLDLVDPLAESPGETLTRYAAHLAGLPRPELQVPVTTPGGTFFVDVGWPEQRVGLEFDGYVKYADPYSGSAAQAVFAEKRRHDLLVEQGWSIRRVVWEDVTDLRALAARLKRLPAFCRH